MRIAIDYNAALRQVGGIGRYTRELVRALAELGTIDQFVLFYAARDLQGNAPGFDGLLALQAHNPRVTAVPIPLSERWLTIMWQRVQVPLAVEHWTGVVDLVHAPDFVLPPTRTQRTILTVHDLSFRIHPEAAHHRLRRYLDLAVPRSLRRTARVLADSQSTADDLERLMEVDPEKITVLYPGIGPQFRRVADAERLDSVRRAYGLPERFFLHVGTIQPRKNLERLMIAYREVCEGRRDTGGVHDPVGLVLAGSPGWLAEPILRLARETPGVRIISSFADEDLPAFYTLASGLVYPSLYEGFGFPPLEALACGTPVVASNTSSLPELVGGVAALVDPHDVGALAGALRQLLDDQELTRRARSEGPRRAGHFTWGRTAQQLLEIYSALGGELSTPTSNNRKVGT